MEAYSNQVSPLMDEPPSSPPTNQTNPEEAIAYYKKQYEQLEHELQEFQASSQELEAELERDVEAAEKREGALQEKVESLGFEVEEWKVCHNYGDAHGPWLEYSLMSTDQVQAVKNRGRHSAEQFAERDHDPARFKSDNANASPRYRGGK